MSSNFESYFDCIIRKLEIAKAEQKNLYNAASDVEDMAQAQAMAATALTKIQQIKKWSEELLRLKNEIAVYHNEHKIQPDTMAKDIIRTGDKLQEKISRSDTTQPNPIGSGYIENAGRSLPLSLGERIRKLRDAHGLSLDRLTEKIGEIAGRLALIETNKKTPTDLILKKIARTLDIELDALTSTDFKLPYEREYEDGLGERISKIIHKRGITSIKLAQKLRVSLKTIEDIEKGNNFPAPDFLSRIAEILEVDKRELLYKHFSDILEQSDGVEAIIEDQEKVTKVLFSGLENVYKVGRLIREGADVNAADNDGVAPLMLAAWCNPDPNVLVALIDNGAVVNATDDDGDTPLMYAAKGNPNLAILTTLIENGADVNAADKDGITPLMFAAQKNTNPKVLTTLIANGADVNAVDNDGATAFTYASEFNSNPNILQTLCDNGYFTETEPELKQNVEPAVETTESDLPWELTAVTLFENTFDVSDWKEALVKVCEAMILRKPYIFVRKINEFNTENGISFSFDKSQIEGDSEKLSNGLFVNIKGNPSIIYKCCERILTLCGYSSEDFTIN